MLNRGLSAMLFRLRLARFFGTDAQSWFNLQSHYDMEKAQLETGKALDKIAPCLERAAA